jgi:hypothetical protein
VSYGGTYGSEPRNTAINIIDQRVREMVRQQGLPYSNGSIPQQAVAIPRVTVLPSRAQEGDEVFLLVDGGADLYLYLRSIPGWVRVSDTVPSTAPATTLPADPAEGDTFIYDTGTSGVRWQFVYDTTDGTTYPWLFVGGAPLVNEVTAAGTRTNTTYDNPNTGGNGPTLTAPFAGDYDVAIGALLYQGSAATIGTMSYQIGATTASDNDKIDIGQTTGVTSYRTRRKTLAASDVLLAKYKSSSGTFNFENRFMSLTPVRVG